MKGLLSLDVDGNDYWVVKAMNAVQPRLIIAECNNLVPTDKSLTIKYDPSYTRVHNSDYVGASVLAMQGLFRDRGYRMIGANRHGCNVLFLRNTLGEKLFPEVPIAQIHDNHWTRLGRRTRLPKIKICPGGSLANPRASAGARYRISAPRAPRFFRRAIFCYRNCDAGRLA